MFYFIYSLRLRKAQTTVSGFSSNTTIIVLLLLTYSDNLLMIGISAVIRHGTNGGAVCLLPPFVILVPTAPFVLPIIF